VCVCVYAFFPSCETGSCKYSVYVPACTLNLRFLLPTHKQHTHTTTIINLIAIHKQEKDYTGVEGHTLSLPLSVSQSINHRHTHTHTHTHTGTALKITELVHRDEEFQPWSKVCCCLQPVSHSLCVHRCHSQGSHPLQSALPIYSILLAHSLHACLFPSLLSQSLS
jgi:hypothetical protein